jgi:hypothetical protein
VGNKTLLRALYIRAQSRHARFAFICNRAFEILLKFKCTSEKSRCKATPVPLVVRDEALQPKKRQFMKTAESSETIVSPADAEDCALKLFELHKCGWTTKDTPPPYTWGAAVSCDMCYALQRDALTNAPRESPINCINKIQKLIYGMICGPMRASTQWHSEITRGAGHGETVFYRRVFNEETTFVADDGAA